MAELRIGIDTGGTFTDVAVPTPRGMRIHKLCSTPQDPGASVLDGLATVRGSRDVDLVHGTTVGLNAILTGDLARTAFITNAGFVDLIEIGRQDRREIYDWSARRSEPPVPRELRFAVTTRRDSDGRLMESATATELDRLVRRLRRARVTSIAIGLLHSHAHPQDEHEIAAHLAELGVPITCSADLLPSRGEFERFSTAILNAAITPLVSTYLGRLETEILPGRLRLMRSSGGIMNAVEARKYPARAVFSGPAGGVLAAAKLAAALGEPRLAALDMGGTSTDVSLAQPDVCATGSSSIAGLPLATPAVDLHTVGCGGGSIAYADDGGALRVGPESAGADPGPACYGTGDDPTVTDAHMALGHLGAETLLGGGFPVDPDRSVRAIEALARRLGISPRRCATGILEIADVAMMRALLVITVERAIDPADVPLVAFGGAGGLHAASLAQRLAMPYAIVPTNPGALSAIGLALAGESQDTLEPLYRPLSACPRRDLEQRARNAANRARTAIAEGTGRRRRCRVTTSLRLRFHGQGEGLWIPLRGNLETAFTREHQRRFGFVPDQSIGIEVVELRARATVAGLPLPIPAQPGYAHNPQPTRVRRPPLGGPTIAVYDRAELQFGARITGPAVIEELTGATRIPARVSCKMLAMGLLLPISVEPAEPVDKKHQPVV